MGTPTLLRSAQSLRVLALVAVSLIVGWLVAPIAGWVLCTVGALAMLLFEVALLHRLRLWLRRPDSESTPNSFGAWDDVFSTINRQYNVERQLRARLTSSLDRLVRASEALPDGVIILDNENRIDWCNRAAAHQFSISVPRDRNQPITHLVRHAELAVHLNDSAASAGPIVLRTSHAPAMVLSIQSLPLGDSEKLLLVRDITLLERTETIRRDFVANVSHELRTPLTVVNGFLEHLTENAVDSPATTLRQLRLMREQTERMMRLVSDLLTLSRLEASNTPADEEPIDMRGLLGVLLDEGRSLSQGRHNLQMRSAAFDVRGNAFELRTAFSNLVSNAVRYTPAGGKIELIWEVDPASARFTVSDNGIGIPAEHIPRLTERFYRVDRGRSRDQGGTGLGLAIVRHVLLRHDATLEVFSEPDRGSRFSCVFARNRLVATDDRGQVPWPFPRADSPC